MWLPTHHYCTVKNSWFSTEPLLPLQDPPFAHHLLSGNSNFLWISFFHSCYFRSHYLLTNPSLILHIGICSHSSSLTYFISLSRTGSSPLLGRTETVGCNKTPASPGSTFFSGVEHGMGDQRVEQVKRITAESEEGALQSRDLRSRRTGPERDAKTGRVRCLRRGVGSPECQHWGEDAASPGPGWPARPQGPQGEDGPRIHLTECCEGA